MQYPAHPCHGSGTATHRGAGQFILYGAGQDDSSESSHERLRSAYQKAVPGATYYLTNSGDTTHTFLISGSNLSDVSKLTVEGGTLVTDSLGVSAKNGVYTVTGGVTVSADASALVFNYDGKEFHSINFDRTKLDGVIAPYVTSAELVQAYGSGDFFVKLSGFNLGSDAAGYSGVNYSGETYTCTSLTESNGIYTLRFTPDSTFASDGVDLQYNGNYLETPGMVYDPETGYGPGLVPVSVWVFYPGQTEEDIRFPDIAKEYPIYVGAVRGNQSLTIYGKGFDSNAVYTACFLSHTAAGFDEVKTLACTYVSAEKLTVNAASIGTGWYTLYLTQGDTVIPQFQDVALYEDVSGPQLPEITVNGGKVVTTSQTITLSIKGGDYTEVRVAESLAALASAEWQAADSLTSYTLSEGYGEKTLHFEFRTAENETYSETIRVTYSDTALRGAEYGISGAADGNKVYIGSKYTLFIKYTGTGYVKGQTEVTLQIGGLDAGSAEDGNVSYKRTMYFSPEISEAAGITTAEASPATFNARSVTDTALQGIDFVGNLQGGADFFHSLNGEMAEQFKNTALGSQPVGTAVTVLGAVGTAVKIISGPSREDPDALRKVILLVEDSDTRKRLYGDVQDYIKLSNDLYYTDCVGSSVLTGISFIGNATPLTKGATLFGGIAFGAVNSWTADEIKTIYASIQRSILAELQLQDFRFGREFRVPQHQIMIDPSGYVFEAVEDNRVEGVTATVFEVDVSGKAVAWTDKWAGQENPQTTGSDGRYGWDVPTGTWKVSFDKEGYQHAESKTMKVYPAHTEVNIGLLSTAVPKVNAAAIVGNELEVEFSMYMQADASSCAITVYDADMQIVPGTVSFPKAVENTGYKDGVYQRDAIAAEKFTRWATFTPSEDYVGGFHDGETYTVKVSKNALSYAGVPMAADYTNTEMRKSETVSTLSTPTASVDSGVFKTIQTVSLTAGDGASIFYTTDGTEPSENSALYTGPITLSTNTTLKFIAIKPGYQNSPVVEKTYAIELSGKASKPTASVTSGTYSGTLSVELSSTTPGAKIHYTLDGSQPTTSSAEYVSPISISATTTLKAIAVIDGLDSSEVSTFEYRISSGNSGGGNSGGSSSSSTPTYKVESVVSKNADGSVSFSKSNAKKGDAVTITVTPDRYYKVDGVTVKDQNGKEITVTDNGDGTFTFKMPDSKVTVEPVFSWDNPFGDVAEDTYYTPAVEWALKNGVTDGTSATTFSPNAGCTRGQIVTFLWKAAGCPEPAGMSSFTDVSADAYYAKAVALAVEQGITNGTGDGKFSPDAVCTRSQSMTFIYRREQAQGGGMQGEWMLQNPFADVNPEDYYGEAVMWAVANGVTSGTSDTTFSPDETCTRGQIVTFLYRFFVK